MTNMNKEKIVDKNRYDERQRFWTEQALNQFGTASNFFFLISLGFLAFLFDREKVHTLFPLEGQLIDTSKLFFVGAIILALISLFASSITVLSRLHDLRLTRHTIWTRKRYYDKHSKLMSDEYIDLKPFGFYRKVSNFFSTLWTDSYFITDDQIENKSEVRKLFHNLRRRNMLLAKFSWLAIATQIWSLFLSLIVYGISVLV